MERSDQSNTFESVSLPITIPRRYIPEEMYFSAVANANTNPLHAAVRSKAKAREAPILACTRAAVDGIKLSGVIVATTMKSISSASKFAFANNLCATIVARSLVVSSFEM